MDRMAHWGFLAIPVMIALVVMLLNHLAENFKVITKTKFIHDQIPKTVFLDLTVYILDFQVNVLFHTLFGCRDLAFDFLFDNQAYLIEVRVAQLTQSW